MAAPATDHDRVTTPPASTLDILLGEAPAPRRRGLPDLPDGWQHAVLVRRLDAAEPARREGLLAIAFAVAAVLWAPLGIMAVLAGTEGVFLGLTLLLAVALVAPRPTGVAAAATGIADRVRPLVARGSDAGRTTVTRARRAAGPALSRAWTTLVGVVRAARERLVALVGAFRDAGERAGDVSAPSGLQDPLSRWLDGQSTPRSTR